MCRKQCCRSWCTAVYVSNTGFHLGMIPCWLLNMQYHKMQDFPFDLVFHAVIRRLKCKAVLNVKKGISTFCFCIYLVLGMITGSHVSNIAIYATHYSCRHLNTINSATLGLVWLNYMQPTFVFSLCMSYCNAKIRIECGLSYTIHPVGACPAISLFSSCSKRCIANPGLFCLGCTWQPQGAQPN